MKQGWIIYNGNFLAPKFLELIEWLKEAGNKVGIDLVPIKNNDLIATYENGRACLKGVYSGQLPEFAVFWDKDIGLARHLELLGVRLFNSAKTIAVCDNKGLTIQKLANHRIPIPKTILAPLVYQEVMDFSPYKSIGDELGFPLVIKEAYGSFGEQVYLIQNERDLLEKVKELKNKEYIFQQLIQSSFGRDIRINVVGDKVVAAMMRKSNVDFRANVTAGGKMYPYEPGDKEKELAVYCSKIVGADFTGVDLLFGENNERFLCEINSNAHFKTIYECTGVDVAVHMMEHIKKEMGY